MINKNDCLSILVKLEDSGVNEARLYMKKLMVAREPSIEVLRFIAKQRGFEVGKFYEVLRKSHNKNKSPLYTNIVREIKDTNELVTTLSCMLTQILLYGNKLENPTLFYKEVRAEEISRVLNNYFVSGDLDTCYNMLKVIRADLLVMEHISGRRDLQI